MPSSNDHCHRLCEQSANKAHAPPIIVRFQTFRDRNELWNRRFELEARTDWMKEKIFLLKLKKKKETNNNNNNKINKKKAKTPLCYERGKNTDDKGHNKGKLAINVYTQNV